MLKTFKIILMMVLMLYAGLCMADGEKSDAGSVKMLMVKSGINKQLEQIAPLVQTGMTQQNQESKTLSPEELNKLRGMAARAFDAMALKDTVQKHIRANLSETEIQAVLTWLRSPLGEKITKLEEAASTPAAYTAMKEMGDKLSANSGRVELVKRLDMAVKATEIGVAVALNTQTALIAALTSGRDPEKRPTMENIEKYVAKNKGQIQIVIEQATHLSLLYTYRSLSDAEIAKYIDFAMSASGKKYHSVTAEGVTIAMTDSARVLGSLIMQNASKKAPGTARKQNI
jgi:Uncharacterized protein conserved in bacteria (DUF2059)